MAGLRGNGRSCADTSLLAGAAPCHRRVQKRCCPSTTDLGNLSVLTSRSAPALPDRAGCLVYPGAYGGLTLLIMPGPDHGSHARASVGLSSVIPGPDPAPMIGACISVSCVMPGADPRHPCSARAGVCSVTPGLRRRHLAWQGGVFAFLQGRIMRRCSGGLIRAPLPD